jgi:hypothetical protein
LNLSKNVFNKSWCPKLIFFNENFFWKDSDNFWHKRLTFKVWLTFRWTVIHRQNFLFSFPLSMLIRGQKSCFLGPTIFEIPQPNWY